DFVGFPTPSVPHQVRNPFGEELRYLTGGESLPIEIADFPRLDKRLIRNGSDVSIVSRSDLKPWGSA
ncbi:MAG: cupin, partial [Myxococcota bacterium]